MVINIGLESPQNQAAEVFNKQLDASASIVIALQVNILSSSLCERSDEIIITIIIVIVILIIIIAIIMFDFQEGLGCVAPWGGSSWSFSRN